jgi:hypothetical protein
MRMNEISWQRMGCMNHSANVVPDGKPYKKSRKEKYRYSTVVL